MTDLDEVHPRARRYLLAQLPEAEAIALEIAIVDDPRVHAIVDAVYVELLDDQRRGELTDDEALALARRGEPPSTRFRDRVGAALDRHARGVAAPQRHKARRPVRWVPWVSAVVAAAAIIIVWVTGTSPPPAPEVVSLALVAPTRNASVPELRISPSARRVQLRLPEVRSGVAILTTRGARIEVTTDGSTIEVSADQLPAGLWEIELHTSDAQVELYSFRVVR